MTVLRKTSRWTAFGGVSAIALAIAWASPAAAGPVLPTGAKVTAGVATVSQTATQVSVAQSSQRAIINWTTFNLGAGGTVAFANGSGVTLNRVTGPGAARIDGAITATGSIYILDPSGVIVGQGGRVSVGGTFVASSLSMSDANFMGAGAQTLSGAGGPVVNLGQIDAHDGDVVLAAPYAENQGVLLAPHGEAAILAGDAMTINDTPAGPGRYTVQDGAVTDKATNSGTIKAADVELRAHAGNVYALAVGTGSSIEATGLTSVGGSIYLVSDEGSTTAHGALTAKTAMGAGGFVETSGATVDFNGLSVHAKTWLVDPTDLTVDAAAAATIENNLATTDVVLQTLVSGASGPGNTSTGPGDINITAPITWASANMLTLDAYHSINISAAITPSGGGKVTLVTNDGGTGGDYAFGLGSTGFAGSISFTGAPNTGQSLTINTKSYTLLYSMADVISIPTVGANGLYALATSIDAGGTTYTGSPVTGGFTGTFTGLGHTISNLTINTSNTGDTGLFDYTSGTLRDVGLTQASVTGTGANRIGALVGDNSYGKVLNSYVTGSVTGSAYVGGLVGISEGSITFSYAAASVTGVTDAGGLAGRNDGLVADAYSTGAVSTGASNVAGGLVGFNTGQITNSYATGSVTGDSETGGLVGWNHDGSIETAFATGHVTATAASDEGGLVGLNSGIGSTSASYYDADTTGQALGLQGDGSTGLHTSAMQNTQLKYFDNFIWGHGVGIYPYLTGNDAAGGGQLITGHVQDAAANSVVAADIGVYAGGVELGGTVALTDNNGYYSERVHYGSVGSATEFGAVVTPNAATIISGLTVTDAPSLSGADITALDVFSGKLMVTTNDTSQSAVFTNVFGAAASSFIPQISGQPLAVSISGKNAAGYTMDQNLILNGDSSIETAAGPLTISAPITWSTANTLILDSYTDLHINAAVTDAGPGAMVIYTKDGGPNGDYDFGFGGSGFSGSLSFTGTPGSGQSLSINYETFNLLYSMADVANINTVGLTGTAPSQYVGGSYALATSLDASGTTYTGAIIGSSSIPFGGHFEGLGHTISNLTIQATSSPDNYVGLFGSTVGAVRGFGLVNASISTTGYGVGAVAGLGNGGTIADVYATGAVSGFYGVGGLVGYERGSLTNAWSSAAITSTSGYYVGGVVGQYDGGGTSIQNVHYNIDSVLINGLNVVTVGGLNNNQYTDWAANGLTLSAATYFGTPDSSGFYSVGSTTDLQNMLGFVNDPSLKFKLTADIDLSSVAGFYLPVFYGTLDGGSHTLSNLSVSTSNEYIGFIGALEGSVSNISLSGGSVSGDYEVGGLAGQNDGTITNAASTVSVFARSLNGGGLVGFNASSGTISQSFAGGSVSGNGSNLGGLVGQNNGAITDTYATGAVSGYTQVGGLVGGQFAGTITTSYATGLVTASGYDAGGLIGVFAGGSAAVNSYYDADTSGQALGAQSDGSIGEHTSDLQGTLPSGFNSTIWGTGPGQYPYLSSGAGGGGSSFETLSGYVFNADGSPASAAEIALYTGGMMLTGGAASSGADGYFYEKVALGTIGSTTPLGETLTLSGASGVSALAYGEQWSVVGGNISGLNLTSGHVNIVTSYTSQSAMMNATFGADAATINAQLSAQPLTLSITGTNSSGFTLDQAFILDGDSTIKTTAEDLAITAPITWSTGALLTLDSYRSLSIQAPITASGSGGVTLVTNDGGSGGDYSFGLGLAGFTGSVSFTGTPGSGQSLTINGQPYTLLYSMSDVGNISAGLSGDYALATSLDASGASYSTSVVTGGFNGAFTGLGHTVDGLSINTSDTGPVGLFDTQSGVVRDLGLTNASVYAPNAHGVGALVGENNDWINNDYVTGSVLGTVYVGGLVGHNYATIQAVFSTASVTGYTQAGGLVGSNDGTIDTAFALGSVSTQTNIAGGLVGINSNAISNTYATGAITAGSGVVGGLVGWSNGGSILTSYATGLVTANSGGNAGGLVGLASSSPAITNSYYDADTSGQAYGAQPDGSAGVHTPDLFGILPSGFGAPSWGTGAGLYPYLTAFSPTTPQGISGYAYNTTAVAGAQIGLYAGGGMIGFGAVSSGANGFFYALAPAGSVPNTGAFVTTVTLPGASAVSGLDYTEAAGGGGGSIQGLVINSGFVSEFTSYASQSATLTAAMGATNATTIGAQLATQPVTAYIVGTGLSGFTLDQGLTLGGDSTLKTTVGDLTITAPISWSTANNLTLDSYAGLAIEAAITASGAGQVTLITNDGGSGGGFGFGLGLAGFTGSLSFTGAPGSGQSLTINGQLYTLLYSMSDVGNISAALNGDYALATSLDASGASYSTSVVTGGFSGSFTGLGHTINGLTISTADTGPVGLFDTQSGVVRDLGVTNANVVAPNSTGVGLLVGQNQDSIYNDYATGFVSGGISVGGLVGLNSSAIATSFSTARVSGVTQVGGLAGENDGSIVTAFAIGQVTSSQNVAGGLVGYNTDTITDTYATGPVTAAGVAGGLIGYDDGGYINTSYATGLVTALSAGYARGLIGLTSNTTPPSITNGYYNADTSVQSYGYQVGGSVGLQTSDMIGVLPSGFGAAWGTGATLYPYLKAFSPSAPQSISGFAYDNGGNVAAGGQVGLYTNGALLMGKPAVTGANGFFYTLVPGGTVTSTTRLGETLTVSGDNSVSGLNYTEQPTITAGLLSGLDIQSGQLSELTSYASQSATMSAGFGADAAAITADIFPGGLTVSITATGTSGFTMDQALILTSDSTIKTTNSDLYVTAPITWATSGILTLDSNRNLMIEAPITTLASGGVVLTTNDGGSGGDYSFGLGLAGFTGSVSFTGTPNTGQSLTINGQGYNLLYSMADVVNINAGPSGNYALATSIDASGTTYSTAPVTGIFSGNFTGLGHTIDSLSINGSGTGSAGLFDEVTGVVRDLGVTNASVYAPNGTYVGALVGHNEGVVLNDYVTGSVTGSGGVGGLVGWNDQVIQSSFSAASVSGDTAVGGLAGINNVTIDTAFATGPVHGGSGSTGGLVGFNDGDISNVYATGPVTTATGAAGGLVGQIDGGTITNAYATGLVSTTGGGGAGGLVGGVVGSSPVITNGYYNADTTGQAYGVQADGSNGLQTSDLLGVLPSGFGGSWGTGFTLYPYLTAFSPSAPESISGYAYNANGYTTAGAQVGLYTGGVLLGYTPAVSGANGFFYALVPSGTVTPTTQLGEALTLSGDPGVSGLIYTEQPNVTAGVVAGLVIQTGQLSELTSYASQSATLNTTFGATTGAAISTALSSQPLTAYIQGTGLTGFTLDQPLVLNGDSTVTTSAGAITIAAPISWSTANTLTLDSYSGLNIDAAITASGAGGVIISTNRGGSGGDYGFGLGTGGFAGSISFTGTPGAGQSLVINSQSYTLLYSMSDLQGIDSGPATNYALAQNVDAGGATYSGPIITSDFNHTFTGLGHTVSNLTISSGGNNIAMFARLDGIVRDFGLVNADVSGADNVADLVAINNNGVINDVYLSNSAASGNSAVAGIAAESSGTISNAFVDTPTLNVATAQQYGPIVGVYIRGSITNAHYDIAALNLNGGDPADLTLGGLYETQYLDWQSHGLTLNPVNYFGAADINGAYSIGSIQNLQDMLGFADQRSLSFKLTNNIDLSGSGGAGLYIPYLAGSMDGQGFAVQNIALNTGQQNTAFVGVLAASGVIQNLGVVGGSVSGYSSVGGLVGIDFGAVADSYASASVNGYTEIGGLVGETRQGATITASFATGAVTGDANLGGLVGLNVFASISDSYAMGSVIGANEVGGLVGTDISGTIFGAYAIGYVQGGTNTGGLVGAANGTSISNGYFDADNSGVNAGVQADGSVGMHTIDLQGGLPSGFNSGVWSTGSGLYPYITAIYPSGVQAISGRVTEGLNGGYTAAQVSAYSGGVLLGGASSSSGVAGAFYTLLPAGTLPSTGVQLGLAVSQSGPPTLYGFSYADGLSFSGSVLSGLQVAFDGYFSRSLISAQTSDTSYTALQADLQTTFGSTVYGTLNTEIGNGDLNIVASGAFTVDAPISAGGFISMTTLNGDLTIDAAGSITTADNSGGGTYAIALQANGNFINNAGSAALTSPNAPWIIYSQLNGSLGDQPSADAFGGLSGLSWYGGSASFSASNLPVLFTSTLAMGGLPSPLTSGNRFVYGYQPTLTVTADGGAVTYSGSPQYASSYSVSGLVNGDADSDAFQSTGVGGGGRDVGVYTTSVTGASDLNYAVNLVDGQITINPATLTLAAVSSTKVYDRSLTALDTPTAVGLVGGDTITGLVETFDTKDVGANKTLTLGGGYTVNDGVGGADYTIVIAANTATGSITPATLTATLLNGPVSKVYDGTTAATLAAGNYSLSGVITGDNVSLNNPVSGTYDTKDVGTSKTVTANGLSLSGTDAIDYSVNASASAPIGTITQAALTIKAIANTKTYDGGVTAAAAPTVFGLQTGDTVTGLVETYADKTANTGKTLSVTGYTINDGVGGADYSVTTQTDTTGVINQAALTAALAGPVSKVYDGTTSATLAAGNYGLFGLVSGDSVTLNDPTSGTYDTKDVGTLKTMSVSGLSISGGDAANYTVNGSASAQVGTITKASLVISAATNTKTYDGGATAATAPTVTGLQAGDSVTGLVEAYADKTAASGKTISVTGYTVNDGVGGGDYSVTLQSDTSGVINPANVTAHLTGTVSKVYDGSTAATLVAGDYSLSGVIGGDSVTLNDPVSGTYDTKNVGSSKTVSVTGLSISGADAGDYVIVSGSASANIGAITPASLTITASANTKTYDGGVSAAAAPTFSGLATSDTISGLVETYADKTAATGKTLNVTGYTINDGVGGADYTVNLQSDTTGVINPATLTAGLVGGPISKVYDGTTAATLAAGNYSLGGVIGGDSVSLNDPTTGTYDTKDVGSLKTVTASGLSISGADAANYTVNTSASAPIGTITQAALTITAATNTKTYDGGATAAATPTVSGLQTGDTVTGLAEAYADKTAATGKTLSVTGYTVNDGVGGGDYTVTLQSDMTGVINPATLTAGLVGGPISKVYDGTTAATLVAGNYSLSGVVGGDSVSLNDPISGTYDTKDVGSSKTVSVTGLSISGADAGNYVIVSGSASANIGAITPASLTITASANTKTYDGGVSAAAAPTFSGLATSDTISGLVETYADKTANTGKTLNVTGYTINDGVGGADYTVNLQSDTSGVINPATLTAGLVGGPISKVYDGTTAATLAAGNYSLGGVIGGDSVSLNDPTTGTYDTKDVGSLKTVTASGLSISGADAANYTVNTSASAPIGTITQAALTITAATNTKTYDGDATAAATPTVSGLQTGDTVTGLVEAYADKTADTGKTLSVTGYTVNDGIGGADYTVTTQTNNGGVINPATLTAGLTGPVSKVYDGNTKATLAVGNYTLSGVIGGDSVTLNDPTSGNYDTKDVGSLKTVTVNTLALSGADAVDYTVNGSVSAPIGTISPAALTISAIANTKTYDGGLSAAAIPTVTGLTISDTVTGLVEGYADKNVGSGKTLNVTSYVVNDGVGGADYTVSLQASIGGAINPAAVTVGLTGVVSKTYDGTTAATLAPTNYSLTGVFGTDAVVLNDPIAGTYADAAVGTGKLVTVGGLAISGADAGNYTVTTTVSGPIGTILGGSGSGGSTGGSGGSGSSGGLITPVIDPQAAPSALQTTSPSDDQTSSDGSSPPAPAGAQTPGAPGPDGQPTSISPPVNDLDPVTASVADDDVPLVLTSKGISANALQMELRADEERRKNKAAHPVAQSGNGDLWMDGSGGGGGKP